MCSTPQPVPNTSSFAMGQGGKEPARPPFLLLLLSAPRRMSGCQDGSGLKLIGTQMDYRISMLIRVCLWYVLQHTYTYCG